VVAETLESLGCHLIDADQLGHEALQQPAIREQVVKHFGAAILDANGEINRRRLAAIVFADAVERQTLEGFVFPYIGGRIREEIDHGRQDVNARGIALDAAIMMETGWNKKCDFIIYVDVPREQRLERIRQRRGWTVKDLEGRERAQLSPEEKRARADAIVDNSGSLEATRIQVEELFQRLLKTTPTSV
jgi:dephospho-CoA kinase